MRSAARSACHKSASVNPHHHRLLRSGIVSLPNVQIQAVFSLLFKTSKIINDLAKEYISDAKIRKIIETKCISFA
jgi:hypothetical protein